MPSKLMTIPEALQYARKNKLKGLRVLESGSNFYLVEYVNSVGKKTKKKIQKNTLVYYRGSGKWAVYSPERDALIPSSNKITKYKVKNPSKWANYGDNKTTGYIVKETKLKVGRGKGRKKKGKRKIPVLKKKDPKVKLL